MAECSSDLASGDVEALAAMERSPSAREPCLYLSGIDVGMSQIKETRKSALYSFSR
jgi:hypothetical protein